MRTEVTTYRDIKSGDRLRITMFANGIDGGYMVTEQKFERILPEIQVGDTVRTMGGKTAKVLAFVDGWAIIQVVGHPSPIAYDADKLVRA